MPAFNEAAGITAFTNAPLRLWSAIGVMFFSGVQLLSIGSEAGRGAIEVRGEPPA